MADRVLGQPALIGQTLGHYCIVEKIGAGGMGVVYRARDERLERDVALKVLRPGTVADESARKRFRKEALALSKINHPNIATIHDFDTHQGLDFLVMEYIPGTTLKDKLATQPMAEREVIALGTQLAEGLSTAHEQGVVHRDLKPGNLRLTGDGRLKILDFGLAKLHLPVVATATTDSLSETENMAGTLPYMAPEQVLGAQIDARTDIHAAGLVLYEMATGRRTFADLEYVQIIGAILHGTPIPPGSLSGRVSPELERIVCKCVEREPESRYQSAKELAIDLRRLERYSEPASSSAWVRQSGRQDSSPRRMKLLLGAVVLLLALVAAGLWHKYSQRAARPPASASIAVLPFSDRSSERDQQYFSDGLAEEIINGLAKVPNLRVVARTSAFQFKGKDEDLRVVGRKLNVANILEGSVRREGARFRITAELINTHDGFQLWSESYEGDLTDILTVQDNIAKAVVSSLQVKLLAGESPGTRPVSRINPQAYQDLLQARYFARMGDKDSARRALDHVNRSIQYDPRYASAYALRGSLTLTSGSIGWMDYSEAINEARGDAEKAIELDPMLPDGYRNLSQIQSVVESNCPTAEITLKRARELAPGDADTLGLNGFIAMCLGHQEEAVELLKQALALDPLQPRLYLRLAQNLRDLGRYQESQTALTKALDLSPQNVWIHETRGEVYLAQGRPQPALQEMEKEPPGSLHDLGIAIAYHALGRRRESDAALANLVQKCPNECAYQIAEVFAYRGEVDQAFAWLDRAYRQHDGGLMLFKTDLQLKRLRLDPRYAEMLKTLNLSN